MSFPRYPKYKASGVEWLGEVPQHWEMTRLCRVAALNPSKSEVQHLDRSELVSFLPMEAVGEDGSLDLSRERAIGEVEAGYTYFRDGDVVVAKITPCFENGKGALMAGLRMGVGFGTSELIVVRPKPGMVRPGFLFHVSRSPIFRMRGEAEMYGAGGQKRVPDDFVRGYQLPVPSWQEQEEIAAFLDRETAKIDALVAEQQRLMELLKEKRQAVISHAVTKGLDPNAKMKPSGIDWLGDVPAHWDVVEIKKLAKPGTTITYGIVQAGPDIEGGVPYIRTSDMSGAELSPTGCMRTTPEIDAAYARSRVEEGDLVVAIRASLGKALLTPASLSGANLTQGTAKISPGHRLTSRFLLWAFNSDYNQVSIRLEAKGTTFLEITLDSLRRLPFAIPPIPEQSEIVASIESRTVEIDELLDTAESAITLLQERRAALISAAVTGQIDVTRLPKATA